MEPGEMETPLASSSVSVVVPCFNEEGAVRATVESIMASMPDSADWEVVVVDDGSTDATPDHLQSLERQFRRLRVVTHSTNRGYGAALKTGFRKARGSVVVTIDADGTYPAEEIPSLVDQLESEQGTMVVGARERVDGRRSLRSVPKFFFRRTVNWLVDQPVPDFNSGLRAVRRDRAMAFMPHLPDGFSFTTTLTIAVMRREPEEVSYAQIPYNQRVGRSKIRPIHDTLKFTQLILRTGVYYAPMRVFGPAVILLFTGFIGSSLYDIFVLENLTDKTVILLVIALNAGMMALLADMVAKNSQVQN